ncbi:RA-domain-containing protein [Massarina eburnea CBS 473.64]|uniref:RA-domain-containing protein n=1 Tax=Massarina eburnea CBS 473.64 TaxID=1395130 RepID=A0A6A6SF19_9PLEO|nr:RA-domain-containing protein [Massarina eburnea CBS 473.64]
MTTLAATSYQASKYHEDSDADADDEYERSVIQSPRLPTEYQASSPTDSGPMSTEHTPTTFTHSRDSKGSPTGLITEWTEEQSADFVSDLGLEQYADAFVEQGISGDALIALQHVDLKEIGLSSVGHRLTILKAVYEKKVQQNVPIEPDHYVPLSADTSAQDAPPTQDDLAKVIRVVQARDERIHANESKIRHLEDDLNKVLEENKRLREEILPLVRAFKDSQQPLPTPHDHMAMSPPAQQERAGSSLSRKFSTKRLFLSSGPKNPSPTIPEGRALVDNSSLDPSAAALAASSHLTASIAGGSQLSPNAPPQPSPTSPAYANQNRQYNRSDVSRSGHPEHDSQSNWSQYSDSTLVSERNRDPRATPAPLRPPMRSNTVSTTPNPDGDPPLSGGTMSSNQAGTPAQTPSTNPQVEIFKSFRVSIDDPCHKVLPVALKKYNITADWRQYALYIVHGDQERCLGLNERPLILFKQLDKEGRKPMFMLRKHAAPAEGHVSTVGGNDIRTVGSGTGTGSGFGWDGSNRVQLPGGVL